MKGIKRGVRLDLEWIIRETEGEQDTEGIKKELHHLLERGRGRTRYWSN